MDELLFPGAVATAAIVFSMLMLALIAFQTALIAGAPIGHFAWGGQDRVLPRKKRLGSVTSIALYVVFGAVILQRAELVSLIPFPDFIVVATWVIAGYCALGIVINGISRSKPERWTMAPLCAVLAALTSIVALH